MTASQAYYHTMIYPELWSLFCWNFNMFYFSIFGLFLTDQDDEQYYDFISGAAGMLAIAGIGVAAASAYYLAKKPAPIQPPFNLDNQTLVEVNNLMTYFRLVFFL